jgi:hypothetical protein
MLRRSPYALQFQLTAIFHFNHNKIEYKFLQRNWYELARQIAVEFSAVSLSNKGDNRMKVGVWIILFKAGDIFARIWLLYGGKS